MYNALMQMRSFASWLLCVKVFLCFSFFIFLRFHVFFFFLRLRFYASSPLKYASSFSEICVSARTKTM